MSDTAKKCGLKAGDTIEGWIIPDWARGDTDRAVWVVRPADDPVRRFRCNDATTEAFLNSAIANLEWTHEDGAIAPWMLRIAAKYISGRVAVISGANHSDVVS